MNVLQYYDLKKYDTSIMCSILYQCGSGKFPHIFLLIELCLPAPYCNISFVESYFSFVKVVKSDWRSKLSAEKIEALLRIKKVDGTELIKKHSSDETTFWKDAQEQRKEGNGKRKKNLKNVLERQTA